MEATTDQIATVAALNDIARRTMGVTCRTVITQGIAALDENTQSDILKMIEGFEDFTPDNDPHGEHDAGSPLSRCDRPMAYPLDRRQRTPSPLGHVEVGFV
jgi:hypothetical protein